MIEDFERLHFMISTIFSEYEALFQSPHFMEMPLPSRERYRRAYFGFRGLMLRIEEIQNEQ